MNKDVITGLIENEELFRSLPDDLGRLWFRTVSIKQVNESDNLFAIL